MTEFFNTLINGWKTAYSHTVDFLTENLIFRDVVAVILFIFICACIIWLIRWQFFKISRITVTTTANPVKVDPLAALRGPTAPQVTMEKPASKVKWGMHAVPINYAENNGLEMTLIQPILANGWEPFCVDNGIIYFRMPIVSEQIKP